MNCEVGEVGELVALGWLVKFSFSVVIIVSCQANGPKMLCIKKKSCNLEASLEVIPTLIRKHFY